MILTRRQLRIKVMQCIYAYVSSEDSIDSQIRKATKLLQQSIKDTQGLYYSTWKLLASLLKKAEERNKISQKKYSNKETNYIPRNSILQNICTNLERNESSISKQYTINWNVNFKYLDHILNEVLSSPYYKDYSNKEKPSFEDDKEFIYITFKKVICPSDKYYEAIKDHRITWIDDFSLINTHILKTLYKLTKTQEDIINSNIQENSENLLFSEILMEKTLYNFNEYDELINSKSKNWDNKRIAKIDSILIRMSLVEILYFSEIPFPVCMNEYIEIAKDYSTEKSHIFINGLLHSCAKQLRG